MNDHRSYRDLATSLFGAVVGGLIVAFAGGHITPGSLAVAADKDAELVARGLKIVDERGRTRIQLGVNGEGGAGVFVFDTKGALRLVLGTYPKAESELPFVVLNDDKGLAAGLFRLVGTDHAPYVILKNSGRDRSIYGLSKKPNGALEPFLVNYPATGRTKQMLFGSY